MLHALFTGGRKLALVLIACQLVSTALASPFDFETERSSILESRARGGKFVGSRCTESSQCYSENCVSDLAFGGEASIFRCRRQEPGGPCFEKNNCGSRICKSGGTCDYAGTLGRCDRDSDCIGWLDSSTKCTDKRCKIRQGSACTSSNQCITGSCKNNVCRAASPLPPNSPCGINSECRSGTCATSAIDKCTNPDGTATQCPYSPGNKYCTRYPLGGSCANNGECAQGLCKSGTCSASQDGDACKTQSQCTGNAVCGSNGKCTTPSSATLYPNAQCSSNGQCISGQCTRDQLQKPYYGVNAGTLYNQDPPRCDYLNNGQSGCRTFKDCTTGLCDNGTCQLGDDGDRCQVSYNCQNLCGLDGKCFSPSNPPRQDKNEPCKTNSQCLSGKCVIQYDSVARPDLSSSDPDAYASVTDSLCQGSDLNGACNVSADCAEGSCQDGVCATLPLGEPCNAGTQCQTQQCGFPNDFSTEGTCELAGFFVPCSTDDTCYSDNCINVQCPNTKDPSCRTDVCAAIPLGGTCRRTLDCADAQVCSDDKLCLTRNGRECSSDQECNSGSCSGGLCAEVQ
ncbi:hypothetical protein V8E36_007035 [Tilletia maclaganii]